MNNLIEDETASERKTFKNFPHMYANINLKMIISLNVQSKIIKLLK